MNEENTFSHFLPYKIYPGTPICDLIRNLVGEAERDYLNVNFLY